MGANSHFVRSCNPVTLRTWRPLTSRILVQALQVDLEWRTVTEIPEHLLKRSKERRGALAGETGDATPAAPAASAPAVAKAAPVAAAPAAPPANRCRDLRHSPACLGWSASAKTDRAWPWDRSFVPAILKSAPGGLPVQPCPAHPAPCPPFHPSLRLASSCQTLFCAVDSLDDTPHSFQYSRLSFN